MNESETSWILLREDGDVRKKVIKAGHGPTPPLHARCLVHYVGRLKESGSVFMDTAKEGQAATVVAGRDAVLQGAGLNIAVASMQVGETALIEVEPAYGYGLQGCFSFPAVPPQACLVYEVTLQGFDPVDEGKSSGSMLFEERIEAAERRRLEGNRLFQRGNVTDALGKYAMALSYMDQDFMFQLQGTHEDKANAVRLPLLLNIAACHLSIGDYQGAIEAASQVLAVDNRNMKALFRRGKARRLSGQSESAEADLQAAFKLSPRDPAVAKELQMLAKEAREEQKAAAQLFKGQFAYRQPLQAKKERLSFWHWIWNAIQRLLFGGRREQPQSYE